MAIHTVELTRETLHGSFSREYEPVLTIDSGDTVRFRTLNAGWIVDISEERRFEPRVKGRDDGHALCGPVAIRGAQPGMTLAVQIDDILPEAWGWTSAGGRDSDINRRLGLLKRADSLVWTLDTTSRTGRDQCGHTVALHPFMGVMGMPPDEPGVHSTIPPRFCGGNIDCKELVVGTTLYLPISVPGALFSVGDGHATQGDGEVCGVALECSMERVDLTFRILDDMKISTPHIHTSAAWITLGFNEDLQEATMIALDAMLDLMCEQYQLSRSHALALASLVVDLRITQIVNGVQGVHAVLPHGVIQ